MCTEGLAGYTLNNQLEIVHISRATTEIRLDRVITLLNNKLLHKSSKIDQTTKNTIRPCAFLEESCSYLQK